MRTVRSFAPVAAGCAAWLIAAGCSGGSGNASPRAQLTAGTAGGGVPLTVLFDASGSNDPDGSIVNYAWDFEGDGVFEADTGSVATAQHVYTAAGSFIAAVRVTDNAGATDTASRLIEAGGAGTTEWKIVTVDNGEFLPTVDLALIDGRPALYYSKSSQLRYAVASTPEGGSAGDWHPVTIATPHLAAQLASFRHGLAEVDSRPALIYLDQRLHYAQASSNDGAQTADWQTLDLAYNSQVEDAALLAQAGGPLVATSGTRLALHRAGPGAGMNSADWQSAELLSAAIDCRYGSVALAEAAGRPVLACVVQTLADASSGSYILRYGRSSSATGMLPADWTFSDVLTSSYAGLVNWVNIASLNLQLNGGSPALAFHFSHGDFSPDLTPLNAVWSMQYGRAVNPDGSGAWQFAALPSPPASVQQIDLGSTAGGPAVSYAGRFAAATTQGLDSADWTGELVEAGYGAAVAEVAGHPAIAYFAAQSAPGTGPLRYAILLP